MNGEQLMCHSRLSSRVEPSRGRLSKFRRAKTALTFVISILLMGSYLSRSQPSRADVTPGDSTISVLFTGCVPPTQDFFPTIGVIDLIHERQLGEKTLVRLSVKSRLYEATLHLPQGYYGIAVGGSHCVGSSKVAVLGAPYDRVITLIGDTDVRLREGLKVIAGRISLDISQVNAVCTDISGKTAFYAAVIQHGAYYIENIAAAKCELRVSSDDRFRFLVLKEVVSFNAPGNSVASEYAIRDIPSQDIENGDAEPTSLWVP